MDESINLKTALIIMNMQNDFCDGGPCEVPAALTIVPLINKIKDSFDYTIFVKELHSRFHKSFKINGGDLPVHCVQDTDGVELNSWLTVKDSDYVINIGTLEMYSSDSAFYTAQVINRESNLRKILKNNKIDKIYICGVHVEKFIFSTALDANRLGYDCTIIKDMSVGKDESKSKRCFDYLEGLGIKLVHSEIFINKLNKN